MDHYGGFVSLTGKLALGLALAGVLLRGHARSCWSFPVYLVLVLCCSLAVGVWPERFWTAWFWILQQAAWDIAKLAIGLELLARIVRPFPGARSVVSVYVVVLLVATTFLMIFVPNRHPSPYGTTLVDYHPRMLTATIWLMTGTALATVWYRLPMDSFQKTILASFVPYLVIFTTLRNLLRQYGFGIQDLLSSIDGPVYVAMCLYWAWRAWQPRVEEPLPLVLEQRLQGAA
jgi:hypothetical protein